MLLNYRMRFYLVLFFCVSIFFTSCKDSRNIPNDVLPEHAMAELLTDIHIVDGSLYEGAQQPDSLAKHGLANYMAVFNANHVDTALFRKSLKYYTTRPEIMNEIYTGITRRLQKKIDSLQKIRPKINEDSVKTANLKHKTDSLQKIKTQVKLDSVLREKLLHPKKTKKHKLTKPNALSK
jgi:hypothetical protein